MAKLYKRPLFIASALFIPWVTIFSPKWLSLSGVSPSWSILWLLPWSIETGSIPAAIAGLCLGLVLDSITLGGITQVPALIILGWWWGRLGNRGPKLDGSLKLGLLAWIGSVFLSFTLWLQILLINKGSPFPGFNTWGFETLLLKSLITGLLAPIIVSWLLLIWRGSLRN